jgi:molecular chaperone GrpE
MMDSEAKTADKGDAQDLAAELAAAKALAEENHKKFLYAMADFENYKKRIERQFADIATSGKKALLLRFLPVLDNLERALAHDKDSEGLRGGLNATIKGFEALLGGEGVKPFSIKGQLFDPKLAEAIGTQVSDAPAETVLEEPTRGYYLGEEVLRVAHVIVAKNDKA